MSVRTISWNRRTRPAASTSRRGDARVPFEQGLTLRRSIQGAKLVALPSSNHIVLSHEPSWQHYTDEMCEFLKSDTTSRGF